MIMKRKKKITQKNKATNSKDSRFHKNDIPFSILFNIIYTYSYIFCIYISTENFYIEFWISLCHIVSQSKVPGKKKKIFR